MPKKTKIIKKEIDLKCYICNGTGIDENYPIRCSACDGTGIYKEYAYYHIVNGICFSGDTLK